MKKLLAALSYCIIFCSTSPQAASLVPPPGYYAPAGHSDETSFACAASPAPFTGTLSFPSKYDGDGPSKDTINPTAMTQYKQMTKPLDAMERGVGRLVDKYMKTGNPAVLACAMTWLTSWSSAHALEGPADNYMGWAERKWALASLSGAYLRLKFSSSQPLKAYSEQAKDVEGWLGRIADKVVSEWPTDDTSHKINNHFYWAAWSVMATSVILDRKDLFDWSLKIYDIFTMQVDEQGYLPYELARKTRAFGYHQFAMTPLAMVAAFARANGVDAASRGHNALGRLANVIMAGMGDIGIFEAKTGAKQNLENSTNVTKQAWLEPFCWLEICPDSILSQLQSWRPINNTRLGGDMTAVFHPAK